MSGALAEALMAAQRRAMQAVEKAYVAGALERDAAEAELRRGVHAAVSQPRRKPTRAKQLGVTPDDYARMLAAQGGGCAICGNTPKTRRLDVDHDHRTGTVRGLLCHRCNRALPTWVSAEWLAAAADYLDRAAALTVTVDNVVVDAP